MDKDIQAKKRVEAATAGSLDYEDAASTAADQVIPKKMGPIWDHSTSLDHLADSLTKVKFYDKQGKEGKEIGGYDEAAKADSFIAKASAGMRLNEETGKYEEKFYYEVPMTKAMVEASKEAIKVQSPQGEMSTSQALNYGDAASITATDEMTKKYAGLFKEQEESRTLKQIENGLLAQQSSVEEQHRSAFRSEAEARKQLADEGAVALARSMDYTDVTKNIEAGTIHKLSEADSVERAKEKHLRNLETSLGRSMSYGEGPSDAAMKTMSAELTRSIEGKSSEHIKSMETSLGRSLDYGDDASYAADTNMGIVASLSGSMDYGDEPSRAGTWTPGGDSGLRVHPLDYSDTTKGMVEPTMTSRYGMEDTVAREKYGDQPSGGSAVLPEMSTIADYLVSTQAGKLDQIYKELQAIRENTSGGGVGGPIQIGARGGGIPPSARPGVKNIAMDLTRGRWDLTFGDSAAGAVTTDGRGGS
jgi:hypothetical protein